MLPEDGSVVAIGSEQSTVYDRCACPEFQNPASSSAAQESLGLAIPKTQGKKESRQLAWPKPLAEQARRRRYVPASSPGRRPPDRRGSWPVKGEKAERVAEPTAMGQGLARYMG